MLGEMACVSWEGLMGTGADIELGVFMEKCVDEEVGVRTKLPSVSVGVPPSSSDPSGVGGSDAPVMPKTHENSLSSGL
jgi:hypothetical protein